MNFEKADERYHSDPAFHDAVNCMETWLQELNLAPSELREAAVYAAIRFEMRKPHTHRVDPVTGQWNDFLILKDGDDE